MMTFWLVVKTITKIVAFVWVTMSFVHGATMLDVKLFPFRKPTDSVKVLFYLIIIYWWLVCLSLILNLF